MTACSGPEPGILGGEGASEPQPQTVVVFVWRYYVFIWKFWIPSFAKMPEALAPVDRHSCVASAGGGPHLGCHGSWLRSERAAWDPSPCPIPYRPVLDACCVPVSGSDGGPASVGTCETGRGSVLQAGAE